MGIHIRTMESLHSPFPGCDWAFSLLVQAWQLASGRKLHLPTPWIDSLLLTVADLYEQITPSA